MTLLIMPYKRKATNYRANLKVGKVKRTRYGYSAPTITSDKYVIRQGRTDYAMTLIDPFKRIPVRIPDLASYETVTFTNELHGQWKVSPTSETTAVGNQILVVNLSPGGWVSTYSGGTGTNTTGAGSAPFTQQIGGSNTQTRYKAARLVSAAVKITYSDNDTNTAGEILGAFIPADYGCLSRNDTGLYNWTGGAGLDANGYPVGANYDLSTDVSNGGAKLKSLVANYYEGPLRSGVMIRYKPQDALSFNMDTIKANTGTTVYTQTFGVFVIECLPVTATTMMQVDIVCNYEGVLKNNDLGLLTGVSESDPGALAHGINAAGKSATAFASTGGSLALNVDSVIKSVA